MSQKSLSKHQNSPLNFLKRERSQNKKRDVEERKADFNEIYRAKPESELSLQAGRCLDCGNPYCEWKCPLHNYIPNWLELVAANQYQQAAELMHETNPFPEICGRVCPQDRLCEQACTINTGFGAVTIGAIEKNISDRALANKWRPDLTQRVMVDKKVAIIGAGPAGLGCAELLARNGVEVTVFDKYPEIGGLLTFGIPNFKLDKSIIRRRRHYLEDIGINFQLNTEVGQQVSIDELKSDYDAMFVATGCYSSVTGNLVQESIPGVINAIDYLVANINYQQNYRVKDYPYQTMQGKKVVVLGGGDTAMDCVRSAVRQNAEKVTCVYRRDNDSMPGSSQEVRNAKEEGVEFLFNRQPVRVVHTNGQVTGIELATTELRQAAACERKEFVVNSDQISVLEADVIILAFGFSASPANWLSELGVELKDNGLVKVGQKHINAEFFSQQTSSPKVFSGGDMVRGADLVVTAIADGRKAASEILSFFDVD